MSTRAEASDEGGIAAVDEPIPEVGAGPDPADLDGIDAFLHTVRALVHGDPGHDTASDTPTSPPDRERPEPTSRRASRATRRAARKAAKQAIRHERKLESEERRSLRASRRAARRTVDRPLEVARAVAPPAQPVEQPVEQPIERPIEQAGVAAPDAAPSRIPAQAGGRETEQVREAAPDRVEPAVSRRERRRRRREQAARAIAVSVPTVEPDDVETAPAAVVAAEAAATAVTTRRVRGKRRKADVVAVPGTLDDVAEVEPEPVSDPGGAQVVGPVVDPVVEPVVEPLVDRGPAQVGPGGPRPSRRERADARRIAKAAARGESGPPPEEPETLAEYVARVDAGLLPRRTRRSRPRTPRWARRTSRLLVVVAVVVACGVLPWVAPSVPQAISDLFPGNSAPARVKDPTVAPPTDAFVGPVGVVQLAGPLVGVRLQAAGEPREVVVPRLHVDSDVVRISGQSGSLLPPSDPQVLGWWQEGRWAGAGSGTAVVTGHTVHTGGGALDQLDELVVGDGLRVRTDNGWIQYVVQRTRIYSTDELARDADQVFRQNGPGRLVLITCDDWNGSFYESNAVVFATPVEDLPTVSSTETQVPDPGISGD